MTGHRDDRIRELMQLRAAQAVISPDAWEEIKGRIGAEVEPIPSVDDDETEFLMVNLVETMPSRSETSDGDSSTTRRNGNRWGMPTWMLAAAAVVAVAALGGVMIALSGGGQDESETVAGPQGVDESAGTAPSAGDASDTPPNLPRVPGEVTAQNAVAPGVYTLEAIEGTTIEVAEDPALPGGIAYTPLAESGPMLREVFLPAATSPEEFIEIINQFRAPSESNTRELIDAPIVELVTFPELGSTVDEVAATITTANGLTVLDGPDPASLGGAEGVVLDAVATNRVVLATADSGAGQGGNPANYLYAEGSRLRFYVVDTAVGVVVAAISTDEVGFEAWLPVGERFLAGVSFE